MKARCHRPSFRARERGAALVVGLVLLMVITVLAISGMSTATVELQMAGNFQFAQRAFQAAEVGIERAVHTTSLTTASAAANPTGLVPGTTTDSFDARMEYMGSMPITKPGYSLGQFEGFHYDVTSTGTSGRGARTVNVQSFYIVGPK